MATRNELYAKFGVTAEAAQLFETSLGTVVLGARGLKEGWHQVPDGEAATKVSQEIDASTLGRLLGKLKNEIEIDNFTAEQFADALKLRNSLFHGFYERHNFSIQTDAGRDEMLADLEVMHDKLFAAWQVAGNIAYAIVQLSIGHTDDDTTS